jgi:hypothetical protein
MHLPMELINVHEEPSRDSDDSESNAGDNDEREKDGIGELINF